MRHRVRAAASAHVNSLAPALLITSGLSQYGGAAIAVYLFAVAPAPGVAWARLAVAAVVLLAWRRPLRWLAADWGRIAIASALGIALAVMNISFYLAISRIALGPAVAIEYVGPIVLAALTARGLASRLAIVCAGFGVFLITGIGVSSLSVSSAGISHGGAVHVIGGGSGIFATTPAIGAMWAAIAGIGWVGYILFGRAAAVRALEDSLRSPRKESAGGRKKHPSGMDLLAGAMTVAALVSSPMAFLGGYRLFITPGHCLAIVGVALLSSVVPYVLDQIILRRIAAGTFSILTAIFPATSLLVGIIVLSQVPTVAEVCGLTLVSSAVILAHWRD